MSTMNNNKQRDINVLYAALRNHISQRVIWQEKQDNLWSYIKRHECDCSGEMVRINENIGFHTHKINEIIGRLSHYHHAHQAMNLAVSYIEKEIIRITRIIDSKRRLIADVDRGRTSLINAHGETHYSSVNLRQYVQKKEEQVDRLSRQRERMLRYTI